MISSDNNSSIPLGAYPATSAAQVDQLEQEILPSITEEDDGFFQVNLEDFEAEEAEIALMEAFNQAESPSWVEWFQSQATRLASVIVSGQRVCGGLVGWRSMAYGMVGDLLSLAQSDETKEALRQLQKDVTLRVGLGVDAAQTAATEIVRLGRIAFAESGHPAKDVKYAYAFSGMREVFSAEQNRALIEKFKEVVLSMPSCELKTCLDKLQDRLQGDYTALKPYRQSYSSFVALLDTIAKIIEENACVDDSIEEVVCQVLQKRWFATNLENHPRALVELFSGEPLNLTPENLAAQFISLNNAIYNADNTKLGKPLAALGIQCLEGTMGVKYFTYGSNVPQMVNQERIGERILYRFRGASPTCGLTYQEAVKKTASCGYIRPGDEVAPNMRLMFKWMGIDREPSGRKSEHVLFLAKQTPLKTNLGDESGRVEALLEFAKMHPNFHLLIQSVNPASGDQYVVPIFANDEKKSFTDLSSRLQHALVDANERTVFTRGIYLPKEYRGFFWNPHIEWIHQVVFDKQPEFSQKEWLAFMILFYELQKLVIKTDLLEKGVNLIATTDPCKDDLDRGGAQWIAEMVLLGISTGQISDTDFMNYVIGSALGRTILVKKIGMVHKWADATSVILEKLINKDKWDAIKQYIDQTQKSFRVEQLVYPQGELNLYGRQEFDIQPPKEVEEA